MTHAPLILKALVVELEAGEYRWCGCGGSASLPWCDDGEGCEHEGAKACAFRLERDKRVRICQCRTTKSPPYCDASHYKIEVPDADPPSGDESETY